MFINDEAKKVSQEILTANKEMVQNTKDYHRELLNLEMANKLAQQADLELEEKVRQLRMRRDSDEFPTAAEIANVGGAE